MSIIQADWGLNASLVLSAATLIVGAITSRGQDTKGPPLAKPDVALTAKEKHRFEDENAVFSVAFSPDGNLLVGGGEGRSILVWDIRSGKESKRIDCGRKGVGNLVFTPGGGHLAATIGGGGARRLWEVGGWRDIGPIPDGAFTPDGKQFVSHSKGMVQFRGADGGLIREFRIHRSALGVNGMVISSDGKLIATAHLAEKTVKIWDSETGMETAALKTQGGAVRGLRFAPAGEWLSVASEDKHVRICDTKKLEVAKDISFISSPRRICFSPDGKWLAVGFAVDAQEISIRDVATGKEALSLKRDPGVTWDLTFNAKGTLLAAATDRFVQVWEITEQKGAAPEKAAPEKKKGEEKGTVKKRG